METKMSVWPQVLIDINREYSFCFGCGKDNPIGLRLDFRMEGKTARAEFTPADVHQGWPGIVHGGLVACLLDEAMGNVALLAGMNCLTADMKVRLRRPVSVGETLIITSSITRKNRKLVKTRAAVSLKDGTVIAEGTGTQFIVSTREGKPESDVRK
jgi:uncharacterized protein (TIGR00369 family)